MRECDECHIGEFQNIVLEKNEAGTSRTCDQAVWLILGDAGPYQVCRLQNECCKTWKLRKMRLSSSRTSGVKVTSYKLAITCSFGCEAIKQCRNSSGRTQDVARIFWGE
jgi:hypothetical protein